MHVLLLSRYSRLGASSRVRYLQYLDYFYQNGIKVDIEPLFSNAYIEALYTNGSRWRETVIGYLKRLLVLVRATRYDLLIIEKELFPFLPALAERILSVLNIPFLVDYDDALFHRYDHHKNRWIRLLLGKKIDTVMQYANVVVAGNDYLAERAKSVGANCVVVIPTVVNTQHYQLVERPFAKTPVVGWIGTPRTSRYLKPLLPTFKILYDTMSVRFVAVGARSEDFINTPVECLPWTESTEVGMIQSFDIGIMPLQDSPWERGKCGYKLIQYMACGVPVVASPVGVNTKIVQSEKNGLLASDALEWQNALTRLLANFDMRQMMGHEARLTIENWYSLDIQAPRFLAALMKAVDLCVE